VTGGRAALDYAESQLGVHTVYEHTQMHLESFDMERSRLDNLRKLKTEKEADYAVAEYEFISEARANDPDSSQTAFEKAVKRLVALNPRLRELRKALADLAYDIDMSETNVARFRMMTELGIARMNELGGYFHYLAAIKQAETASKPVVVPSPDGDWPDPSKH